MNQLNHQQMLKMIKLINYVTKELNTKNLTKIRNINLMKIKNYIYFMKIIYMNL